MGDKIDVAELLKDCPKGMELDCTMYDNVEFEGISDNKDWPIKISVEGYPEVLNPYGCISYRDYAKCVIFPKGKTTWEGFQKPFKDGDILYAVDEGKEFIFILKHIFEHGRVYCYLSLKGDDLRIQEVWLTDYNPTHRLATEEEKQKLFQAIKDNGYKWNAETKTLEKLVEPKFKVGDKIRHKATCKDDIYEISKVYDDSYGLVDFTCKLDMKYQDNYELVHNKFDISTLTPFKSKVLVRDYEGDTWYPAVWGCTGVTDMDRYPYIVIGGNGFEQCIPYEGNEHLLGTTDDCDNFYKTWTES